MLVLWKHLWRWTNTLAAWECRSALLWPASCGLCSILLDLYGWANSMYYLVVSPALRVCVCVVLWWDSLLDYIICLLKVFLLPTFHFWYRTGNMWHMTPLRPCFLLFWGFCLCVQVFFTLGTFLLSHTHTYLGDNCHSSPALRSWTGLTTSLCIITWLLPFGSLLFIASMFTRT